MGIHAKLTGTGPGRRRNVEVLNKSAILFTCAAFEAFIETLASEAFHHLVSDAADPSALPKPIRKAIAEHIRGDKNELRMWDLAGDGWRRVGQQYKDAVIAKYTGPFNSPKPHNIEALIRELTGLADIHTNWRWKGMTPENAAEKLKRFVELRGGLAHGQKPAPKVSKAQVVSFINFLAPLSVRSANVLRTYCHQQTGKYPWRSVHIGAVS